MPKGEGAMNAATERACLGPCKMLEAPPRDAPVCRESLGAAYLREQSMHKTPSARSQKKCVCVGSFSKGIDF